MASAQIDNMPLQGGVLIERLQNAVGSDNVTVDDKARRVAAQDVYRSGKLPIAVVSPASTEQVSQIMFIATEAGVPVFVRGGGMSYTDAVTPDRRSAIVLHTDRLNAIREINETDLYATVEPGCTWLQLDEALRERDLRALFWGPMSGRVSTIGGAMSQGAVTFGSVRNGASVAAAVGLEVVLADGSVVTTGSAGQPHHNAFFRDYGPDLTGLFCGDSGALGVKTAITVRLQPRPATGTGFTFAFSDFDAMVRVVRDVASEGYATEIFGAETALVSSVAGPPDLRSDIGQLLTIMRAADNPFAAVKTGTRVALGGRKFLQDSEFLASFLTEGRDRAELKWLSRRIRNAVGDAAVEVANTMAEFTRALPFPEPAVLGPGGKRLLPLHGVVPYSGASKLHTAFRSYLDDIQEQCTNLDVQIFVVFACSGSAGFLYECVIYWRDEWLDLHRQTMSTESLQTMQETEANLVGREFVEKIRVEIIDLLYTHGCTHYQVGRAYPFARERNPAALSVLRQLKSEVDPGGLINPGALGL